MAVDNAHAIWIDATAALNEAKANYDAANALYVAAGVARAKAAAVVTAKANDRIKAAIPAQLHPTH